MVTIGSRGSALALAQATWVREQIQNRFPDADVTVEVIRTSGDKDTSTSLRRASTVGVFVKELEKALLDEKIDIAVHSMKDLPVRPSKDLAVAAVTRRLDHRDVFS